MDSEYIEEYERKMLFKLIVVGLVFGVLVLASGLIDNEVLSRVVSGFGLVGITFILFRLTQLKGMMS